MDIKRMRHAIALAEELNFARAADKLHLSQPALSRSIQTLEDELGLLLFDRDNRNVRLTTVGGVFMEQARRLVFQMRGLERDMGLVRDADMGQVACGFGPLPTASILPGLLRQVRRARPGLQLTITSNNWHYMLVHLRAEELEFFVGDTRDIPPDADLAVLPLCRQYGPFICRAGHPLLDRAGRQPRDMMPYGLAALKIPTGLQAVFRGIFQLAPHERLPIALECDNVAVLRNASLSEDLILVATEAAVSEDIRSGVLKPLLFDNLPLMYAEIGVVHLSGRSLSPAARYVLDQLQLIVADTPNTSLYRDGSYLPPTT